MRALLNLFLVLIICFSSSVIPLNLSWFDWSEDFLKTFSDNNYTKNIVYSYDTSLTGNLIYNPTNIEFIIFGRFDKDPIVLTEDHQIILEAYKGDKLIKKYVNTEIVKGLKNYDDDKLKLVYTLDISQENLNLTSGYYKLKIYSTLEELSQISPYNTEVIYLSDSKYVGSKNNVEENFMYLLLYFPDKSAQYLIPVSRKVPFTRKTIRTTITNLQMGPGKSLGLAEGSPIPEVPSIWVRGGVAYLNMPRDIGKYDQGSTISQIALDTLVNSLTSIYGVEKVKFLQAGKEVESLFHGTSVDEPFTKDNSTKVYLGLETDTKKFLLVPIRLNNRESKANTLVHEIFSSLKSGIINDHYYEDLFATIPANVKLIDFSVEDNGILSLNLSKEFLEAYAERMDIRQMMLDSILFSFTSIPNVEKISIKVQSKEVPSFNGINITEPLKAPSFINIETE